MTEYTKKACNKCGRLKPFPNMVKRKEAVVSTSTNLNRKKSTRLYTRTRTVFYCQDCIPSSTFSKIMLYITVAFVGYCLYNVFT